MRPPDGPRAVRSLLPLLAVTGLSAAAAILLAATEGSARVAACNLSIMQWLLTSRTPALTMIALTLTTLGSPTSVSLLGGIMALRRWREGRRREAALLVLILAGGIGLTALLKVALHDSRPPQAFWLTAESGLGFPSGHTVLSSCLAGFVAARLPAGNRKGAMVVALGLAVADVGWSRLYLGVHWASQVMAGIVIAAAWVAFCLSLVDPSRPPRARES